ncbi:MAG: RNA-directed DNA polymerase [Cytophagales bacterium]|nr:MAG: RNA-directed DNA polymerase [Cytophagales bacterium]
MSTQLTRQQLYDRIRTTSKDQFVLEEMQRLGFWEKKEQPTLSETLIKREADLQKELNELLTKQNKYNKREAMLLEMRKAKMKASKEKQAATKLRNEQKRKDKAKKWQESQQNDIVYLGEGVSAALIQKENNLENLQKYELPLFENMLQLAEAMQIPLSKLRFLAYHRKVSKITHYNHFTIPKKSGGLRTISAPMPDLKKVQQWILEHILYKIKPKAQVHGFVPERSILSNATPHIGKDIVINLDLKDFFPSISYKRVKGLFVKLGYSEQIALTLALLCTYHETEKLNVDNEIYYLHKGERYLPQGSPASPAITTLIAHKMDSRLQGLATKYGFTYTRYADDLTFSANKDAEENINKMLLFVKKVIESEDFELHPDKTKIMRKGSQQKVTGIVVNQKPNVDRQQFRKFRALLHQIEQTGWENKKWGNKDAHIVYAVKGFAEFVHMINPTKGEQLKKKIAEILTKYPATVPAKPQKEVASQTKEETPNIQTNTNIQPTEWWDIFEN